MTQKKANEAPDARGPVLRVLPNRACLALAERFHLPALTADRTWKDLDFHIEVQTLR
jgi:PIN domain nuclease of toxin-antitoxin system